LEYVGQINLLNIEIMKKYLLFIGCTLGLMFTMCVKPPEYSVVPNIKFSALSKYSMVQGYSNQDQLYVYLDFEDGDSDLGSDEADTSSAAPNIFFIDKKNPTLPPETYKMLTIPKQGKNGISGTIRINRKTTCCKNRLIPCTNDANSPALDTALWQVYIKDRAGHKSNVVDLPAIQLICQ
jgi:hypothetical protein